jgi:hypothetical protein
MIKEELKKLYGLRESNVSYLLQGGEIFRLVDQISVLVSFKKNNSGQWDQSIEQVVVDSISDFNSETNTYCCKYRVFEGESDEKLMKKKVLEFTCTPEGFSWGPADILGEAKRILPYSMHCKLTEDRWFYSRLFNLFNNGKSMTVENLKELAELDEKDRAMFLRYSNHIAAVFVEDTGNGDIVGSTYYFRLCDVNVRHIANTNYNITVYDVNGNAFSTTVDSRDNSIVFEELGPVKFINLAEEKASTNNSEEETVI